MKIKESKMKITCAILSLLFIGAQLAQSKAPLLPDVEYSIECSQDTSDTLTAEIWVRSYADHGISCAFVDLTANLLVLDITYGQEYTVFTSGEIDDFGIVNFGGCSFIDDGVGQTEWSLVATVDFDTAGAKQFRAFLDEPSNPSLITSIYGEGFARTIDYGKTAHCRISSKIKRNRGS